MMNRVAAGGGGHQQQTQVVFVRLDPILQSLLKIVTRYQELAKEIIQTSTTTTAEKEFLSKDEVLVPLLNSIIDILQQVQVVLDQFGSPFAPGLIVLAEYISLPLNAILHINSMMITAAETNQNKVSSLSSSTATVNVIDQSEIIRRQQIRLGRFRKLNQVTAKTIQSYVQQTCSFQSSSSPTFDKENPTMSLSNQHLKKFLISLVNVLPAPSTENNKTNDSSSSSSSVFDVPALDDGSDSWLALLAAINNIIHVSNDSNGHDEATSPEKVVVVLESSIVLRISDSTSFLALSNNYELSLQALQSLHCILMAFPDESLWQFTFPGIFASLYRCLIRIHRQSTTTNTSSGSGLSTTIECKIFQILRDLFLITLGPIIKANSRHKGNRNGTNNQLSAVQVLEQLQSLAVTRNNNNSNKDQEDNSLPSSEESTTTATFLKQVKTRVVTPLSVLLHQGVISPSEKVRIQVASLCKSLLVETGECCWESTNILDLAFESCLILQTDEQENVATCAGTIIQEYKEMDRDGMDSSWMIQKIHSITEKVSVLAQGSKLVELRSQLQLLIGYIQTVDADSLAALSTAESLRNSLMSLVDISFDFSHLQGAVTDVEIINSKRQSSLHFRHLNKDIGLLVRKMLQTLGMSLGFKHGAIMVDACISDFYEATLGQLSSGGEIHVEFLHQWIGSIVVAKEVLEGAFHLAKESRGITSKQLRRRRRVLESLALSILPLLVDSPLWSLSTERLLQDDQAKSVIFPSKASAMHGNTCVIVLMLEFASIFFELLSRDIGSIRSFVLYPIIEKANQMNNRLVQRAAQQAVLVLAKACQFDDINVFIYHEFSALLATMLGRLHLPGGLLVPANGDLQDTLAVLSSMTWVLKTIKLADSEAYSLLDKAKMKSLIDLISLLEDRFDQFSLRKLLSDEDIHDLAILHQECFEYLNMTYGANRRTLYTYPSQSAKIKAPWMNLLSHFSISSAEGLHPEKDETVNPEQLQTLDISMAEIELISKLITKDNYLLSNMNLRVQVSACESLTSGYQFLAFVSCHHEDVEDAQRMVQNSILRQTASSWPSIKARLHNVMDEIIGSKLVSLTLIVRSKNEPTLATQDIATQRFFLAKIFTLIGTMCECSGEFMADRFKHDVWPAIGRYLGHVLGNEKRQEEGKRRKSRLLVQSIEETTTLQPKVVCHLSDSERHLLLSIFECLGRVFDILALPESVLVPAGAILLPFLDCSYYHLDLASSAMNVLKKLANFNCDVLCRPLLELSGRGIPICPLFSKEDKSHLPSSVSIINSGPKNDSILATKASELLDYINSLPEQCI